MASSFFPLSDGTSFVEIPDGTDPKDVPALAANVCMCAGVRK